MNTLYYTPHPIEQTCFNKDKWPQFIEDYKDYNLDNYLLIAQEILEKQYCHLFSDRLIDLTIINYKDIIPVPIGFIKKIIKFSINNINIDDKYVEIIDFFHIKLNLTNDLLHQLNNKINIIQIQYSVYSKYNNEIEYELMKKTIKLINKTI